MPDSPLSRDELYTAVHAMTTSIDRGFTSVQKRQDDTNENIKGVHARLDTLNGKTSRHGDMLGEHSARLRLLEANDELDVRRNQGEDEQKPITRREVYVMLSTGGGMLFLMKVLPWLMKIASLNP